MRRNVKRLISCFLAVLLLFGYTQLAFHIEVEAADVTMQEVKAIILEGNRELYEYTSLDIFDLDYFTIPEGSEETRAGYEAKAIELTQGLTDDMEKAEAIHRWISENVYYDYDYYNNPGQYSTFIGAAQVFENKRTICEGYAALLTQMLRCVGIPARHVLGYGINTSLTPQELLNIYNKGNTNHAWTEFYCNGKWYFADATWDSGNKYENQTFITGKYRDRYFALSVEEYSLSHIPVYYYSKFLCNDFIIHVTKSASNITDYVGGAGVVEIPSAARITKVDGFMGNTDITEVIIPEGVTSVGSFNNCTALKKIVIPETVSALGSFDGCTSLESIVIPDLVTSSPDFDGCSSLKTVHLGKGIKRFDSYTFRNCLALEKVTGGENLTYLSGYAFYNCPLLQDAACFQNLSYVDSRAFYKCPSMKTVVLTDRTEALYDYSFYGMTSLETVIIPSGNKNITSIGYAAFYQCKALETLVIPSTVTSIGEHAFNGTSNLKTVLFEGTQEQWDAITVGNYNSGLTKATVVCLEDHIHSYTETETLKATCVSEGEVTYTCQCTDEYAHTYSKLTKVAGHSLISVTTDASCTVDGKTVYTCENCDYSYTEAITAPGHDYEDEFTVDKQASCEEEGSKSRHCKNCDDVTDVTVIEKAKHDYTEKVSEVPATCSDNGSITWKCVCGAEKTEKTEKDKSNHNGETELKNQKTATCAENGYTGDTYCKSCGELVRKGNETAPTGRHSYSSTVVKEPSCNEEGIRSYICVECDNSYSEKISTVDHKDNDSDSKCDFCGKDLSKKCDHLCHKDGFMGIIWKIVSFFLKLFKINPVCECGAAHY